MFCWIRSKIKLNKNLRRCDVIDNNFKNCVVLVKPQRLDRQNVLLCQLFSRKSNPGKMQRDRKKYPVLFRVWDQKHKQQHSLCNHSNPSQLIINDFETVKKRKQTEERTMLIPLELPKATLIYWAKEVNRVFDLVLCNPFLD